jgi:hypothetical protein
MKSNDWDKDSKLVCQESRRLVRAGAAVVVELTQELFV